MGKVNNGKRVDLTPQDPEEPQTPETPMNAEVEKPASPKEAKVKVVSASPRKQVDRRFSKFNIKEGK